MLNREKKKRVKKSRRATKQLHRVRSAESRLTNDDTFTDAGAIGSGESVLANVCNALFPELTEN